MRLGLLCFLVACAADKTSSTGAEVTGDDCAVHNDQASCAADTGCQWEDLGRPCQDGQPCVSGVCSSPPGSGGGGSGSGSSSGHAACACPNGGVCFEQIGGTAQQGDPEIQCATPSAGSGDPCSLITGEGTCTDDPNVTGLCLCDNGIR